MTPEIAHLRKQFAYDRWANARILGALELPRDKDELKMMIHIGQAAEIWLRRVQGQPARMPKPDGYDLPAVAAYLERWNDQWQAAVAGLTEADLGGTVSFSNQAGEEFTVLLRDVCTQIIIHGQHHRAQIARALRLKDVAPPPTDFMKYALSL